MPLPTLLVPGSLRLSELSASEDAGATPISYIQNWLRRRMPEFGGQSAKMADRLLIVRAETGSGKSTVLPVSVFRILRAESTPATQRFSKAGVICTQPRVLTAVALARDVSAGRYPDMVLGETVGYQTAPTSSRAGSGLTYATAGVLAVQLRHMTDAELMGRYRFIIVDEAHERSLDTDITLLLLRNFLLRNIGDMRAPFVLLTSATIDPLRYAAYFGVGPANVIDVAGRSYPITTHWPAAGFANYPAAAAELVQKIHTENSDDPPDRADILVFMPGAAEALAVAALLKKRPGARPDDRPDARPDDRPGARPGARPDEKRGGARTRKSKIIEHNLAADHQAGDTDAPFLLLVINRDVVNSQTGDYSLVFAPPETLRVGGVRPRRRVIVSTSVAETGLTIDTLKYVIDCGWSRMIESYQPWRAMGLTTRPAPRSRIAQRRGRVGRLFPGEFYPLYTENVYGALDEAQLPDVVIGNSASVFIALVAAQQRQKLAMRNRAEFLVDDLGLLDPPPPEALLGAICCAKALGLLAADTPLPCAAAPIPVGCDAAEAAGTAAAAEAAAAEAGAAEPRGYGLTPLGWVAARFSHVPMEAVRVLLAGYTWGTAASDLLTAVSMFGRQSADLFLRRRGASGATDVSAAALAAAAPPYLWTRSALGEESVFYRTRLLLADDFAEVVLIFDAFLDQLAMTAGDLSAVEAWCAGVGLRFSGLLELAALRERYADEMVAAGLDPFRGAGARLAAADAAEFTPALCRLKRCLFDGLQMNLLRFMPNHPAGPGYVTHYHAPTLRVRCPMLYTDAMADRLSEMRVSGSVRPQWVLTDQLRLAPAPRLAADPAPPLLYSVEANLVMVLDGYVDFDPERGRLFD